MWPDRGARDIRAGYLQPSGGSLQGKFTVCPAPGEQREPAIVVNGANSGFLIAGQDQRSGRDFDTYAYVQLLSETALLSMHLAMGSGNAEHRVPGPQCWAQPG